MGASKKLVVEKEALLEELFNNFPEKGTVAVIYDQKRAILITAGKKSETGLVKECVSGLIDDVLDLKKNISLSFMVLSPEEAEILTKGAR